MGFSRQEYWSGLPWPLSGDLPNSGIELVSPALQMDSLLVSHWGSPGLKSLNLCKSPNMTDHSGLPWTGQGRAGLGMDSH